MIDGHGILRGWGVENGENAESLREMVSAPAKVGLLRRMMRHLQFRRNGAKHYK
jgi:hypothetical protein